LNNAYIGSNIGLPEEKQLHMRGFRRYIMDLNDMVGPERFLVREMIAKGHSWLFPWSSLAITSILSFCHCLSFCFPHNIFVARLYANPRSAQYVGITVSLSVRPAKHIIAILSPLDSQHCSFFETFWRCYEISDRVTANGDANYWWGI